MLHLALIALLASAGDVPASLRNARLQTHSASSGLAAAFEPLARQPGPAWIGYAVPANRPHRMCFSDDGPGAETADVIVLFRVANGRVDRVRPSSRDCDIDLEGRPLHWLTGVRPQESLALLEPMAVTTGKSAVAAIALHAGPGADEVLERLVAPARPLGVRKEAAFWMGNARGRRGYETLERLAADPDSALRAHVVFALGQSDVPEAIDTMIAVGRGDADARVRGQALFWLGQKAGSKAVAAITRAVAEDPESAVRKKAVFALSQLPRDEGVPLLIDLARGNSNPVVRKQAMFWLGQSEDPRALALFAEILGR